MNRHKIQERYKALNEGDKQSYDIKLDKWCSIQLWTLFLRAIRNE
jgi:hypothetical protein